MCRPRPAGVLAVALLLWAGAPHAVLARQAGPSPQSMEELERRLEALRPRLQEAEAAMEEALARRRAEQAALERQPVDTIRVGPLRIVTPPDQAELAQELFSDVWNEEFGDVSGSPSLERRFFTFQWRVRPDFIYMVPEEDGGPPVSRVELHRLVDRTRARARARILGVLSEALLNDFTFQSPLRRWLGRGSLSDLELASAYRELALSAEASGVHRACLSDEAAACWASAGLGYDGSMATLERWFPPEVRRQLAHEGVALSNRFVRERLPLDPGTEEWACVEEDSQAACDRILQANFGWPRILPYVRGVGLSAVEWTLFWHALQRGGEGAWGRTLERAETDDPGDLLTYVSGLSADELAASWQDAVVAHRPLLYADLATARWSVLLWILVFAAFAMRSTRWRST